MSSIANEAGGANNHPGLRPAHDWLNAGPKTHVIDGRAVPARSGRTLAAVNPASEDVLAEIAEGDKADVDLAVAAARRALEASSWKGISPHLRTRILLRIAEVMEAHAAELAALDTLAAPY